MPAAGSRNARHVRSVVSQANVATAMPYFITQLRHVQSNPSCAIILHAPILLDLIALARREPPKPCGPAAQTAKAQIQLEAQKASEKAMTEAYKKARSEGLSDAHHHRDALST